MEVLVEVVPGEEVGFSVGGEVEFGGEAPMVFEEVEILPLLQ